jgi:FMN-dependent NADH-azoreductase
LQKAWREFLAEWQDKKSNSHTKQTPLADENITSLDELNAIVLAAKENCKGAGRLRHYLDKLCQTLNSHSNLFDMLPNQNQYCSIFCGAIKTLVKVGRIVSCL